MHTSFAPDFFSANRDRLRAALGDDTPVIIAGNGQMQRGADEAFKFHQDSGFWYLTGLSAPDLTLVMTANDTYLVVPGRSSVREAFDGAHDIAGYAARSGITTIVDERDGWQRIRSDIAGRASIATLAPAAPFIAHYGIHTLPYRRRLIQRLRRLNAGTQVRDIRTELASLRVIKQPEELQALQRAIDITGAALQAAVAPELFSTFHNEYELEAYLDYQFRLHGADGNGFPSIVGAGAHSTTLHHVDNAGPIKSDDLIVLDVGAAVEHYSADITRTVSRRPLTGRRAAVWQAVGRVQDYALAQIRPGVMPQDYEHLIEARIGEELRGLGLITTAKRSDIRRYYPHATSHFLGLDTHDVGDYRTAWQAGMVITCEPGIYIPEEGIGVRLEDDILITPTGHTVLSAACPRALTAVQ